MVRRIKKEKRISSLVQKIKLKTGTSQTQPKTTKTQLPKPSKNGQLPKDKSKKFKTMSKSKDVSGLQRKLLSKNKANPKSATNKENIQFCKLLKNKISPREPKGNDKQENLKVLRRKVLKTQITCDSNIENSLSQAGQYNFFCKEQFVEEEKTTFKKSYFEGDALLQAEF